MLFVTARCPGAEGHRTDGVLSGSAHDANMCVFTDHLATSITAHALAHGIAYFCNDHCESPSPRTVERICDLKPFVTVQPAYAWIEKRFLHGYKRYLSTYQIANQVPLARFARADMPPCGSSDSPVRSVDPFLQMQACVSST